jgi:ABC-type antimicrobial peptide transport system permease subunit
MIEHAKKGVAYTVVAAEAMVGTHVAVNVVWMVWIGARDLLGYETPALTIDVLVLPTGFFLYDWALALVSLILSLITVFVVGATAIFCARRSLRYIIKSIVQGSKWAANNL